MILIDLVQSPLGGIHLASSCVALVLGAIVLFLPKGTPFHRRSGYAYVITMIIVLGSALGLYHLTGRFGLFHVFALIGFLTLAAGMLPMWIRSISRPARTVHLWFMYYSVLGLYAALASELIVRIPDQPFYPMVGVATFLVFGLGSIYIIRKENAWSRHFGS
ncbi:MAG: hypothetical protein KDC19_08440 [Saprospiraceae bacterium]|nr:hypothetical protein [Saprospiraceae bacterium]